MHARAPHAAASTLEVALLFWAFFRSLSLGPHALRYRARARAAHTHKLLADTAAAPGWRAHTRQRERRAKRLQVTNTFKRECLKPKKCYSNYTKLERLNTTQTLFTAARRSG